MKKQWIFSLGLFLSLGLSLFSCANEQEKTTNMQEPKLEAEATGSMELVIENLNEAFKGETTASAKYAAYAQKAQEEGKPEIALLFKTASQSEAIHANNHKAVLEDLGKPIPEVTPEFSVKTSLENLNDALAGETYEINTMYPEFMTNAQSANAQLALISLKYAYETEQKHQVLYQRAIAALGSNQLSTLATQYYICPTCGNTYDGKAPKRCGISMTSGERFILITSA